MQYFLSKKFCILKKKRGGEVHQRVSCPHVPVILLWI